MSRSSKANAICRVFANSKDRVINRKADSAYATLPAQAAAAFYRLCGSLRGLLYAVTAGTHAHESTKHQWCTWMGMQRCPSTVRRHSPDVVVRA